MAVFLCHAAIFALLPAPAFGVVVFDNMSMFESGNTNAHIAATAATPNTWMGSAYNLVPGTMAITGFDVYPVNLSGSNFDHLKITIDVWGSVNTTGTVNASTPAFSNLLGSYVVTNAGSFNTGFNFPIGISLGSPIPVTGTTIGLSFNYQGSTDGGASFSSINNLASLIAYGVPPSVGSEVFSGYYRNAASEADGNFTSSLRSLGFANQSLAVRVYGNTNGGSGCAVVPPGLVSWWSGAGNGDDVTGNNTGTLQNGATFAAGKVGSGFLLDGFDDYVDCGNAAALNFVGTSFSVEAWIYLTRAADGVNSEGIVSRYPHDVSGNAAWLFGRASSGELWFGLDTDGFWPPERNVYSSSALSLNQWHHVAGVYDHGTGLLTAHVDGVLRGSSPGSPVSIFPSTAKTTIGCWWYYSGSNGGTAIPGVVDEVALYNRALYDTEIQAIYDAGSAGKCPPVCTPAPSGLVSWWPGAGNGNDVVGTNNGTLQNGVTFAAGKVGRAFSFDGVDGHVIVPDSPSLNVVSGLTIEAWIKTSDAPSFPGLVVKFNSSSTGGDNRGFSLSFDAGGKLRCDLGNGAGSYSTAFNPKVVTDGQWHHVAAAFDSSRGNLYVDGAAGPTATVTGFAAGTSAPLYLGRDPSASDRYFHGLIDEVALYNRALTVSEILAIRNADVAGKCLTPLYISSINRTGNSVNLSWLAQKGMTYRMQSKTNLDSSVPWQDVGNAITATNGTVSTTDTNSADPERFYRVRLLP